LDVELPSNEAIHEAMAMTNIPWKDMHHQLLFIPELETLKVEFQINP
jgi:hypothetical protein